MRLDACSAIAGAQISGFMGANYDWRARGGIVFESPRGQVKTAVSPRTNQKTFTWTSRLASMTLSQFGRDFPMQGLNEAGLAGVVLMGPAGYPSSGPRGVVTENLWLQYQLDQYETVADVLAHVGDLGIDKLSASLHWFLCDRLAQCAVVEFQDGQATTYSGSELEIRALTNSSYAASRYRYGGWLESQQGLPVGYDSNARFIRLAEFSQRDHFGDSELSIVAALSDVAADGYTAWQTVFDLRRRRMHVRLYDDVLQTSSWQVLSVESMQTGCRPELRMITLGKDFFWRAYDHEAVDGLFADAAQAAIGLDPATRQWILRNAEAVVCESDDL